MAKAKSGGFSLDPDDQVSASFFGPGPAVAKSHIFGMFDYNGTRKGVPALLVTFDREGEERIESYTVGAGWKVIEEGITLKPLAGQSGLNSNCKAAHYMAALRDECGMPKGFVSDDITVLDGIGGNLISKPLDKIKGSEKESTVLIFEDAESAPWLKGGSAKAKAKAADDDEDEAPVKKGKKAPVDDDEDEEEAAPKKKDKTVVADEDDEADDEDLLEAGIEALIAALDDGPLKLANVEGAVAAQVKKHPQKKAIAALMALPKTLKQEKGWSFDGKRVTLD